MPTPDFVLELRSMIGTAPLWLSGATAVIVDGTRVLLIRRADTGEWAPVTGVIDPGEQPAETAVRESLEEAGVLVDPVRLASIGVSDPMVYENGDRAQYLDFTFRCHYVSGTPEPVDGEASEVAWFERDALPVLGRQFVDRVRHGLQADGPAFFSRPGT
jgi:8-oxo-dGTP pyrophosphatase MutT (NUDIX family)